MKQQADRSEPLDRILVLMELLQENLEAADLDITEFEEVEIFLELAIAAGARRTRSVLERDEIAVDGLA